ncbi:cupredoxin family copper-binding protein [Nocardia yamanashiensis]|uniref:cupredoxin domain-containing protein n=1 Tax=Nocardia yamanashiensis TaxID=209247 RepID=UPI001E49875D|nr:cupredoxin family copper-binding protein [Nocardia yamanashiensis]UGT39597.1 cupredoxin family copper-binding protein [Nocardia yamanashiensis]
MPIRRNSPARALFLVTLVAGALAVGGCGSDSSKSGASSSTAATSATTTPAGPRPAATTTVNVDDMKFSPANLTVKVGDTVQWKFSDKAPHAVQGIGDAAMGINSPIIRTGEWSYTFTTAGTFRYLCPLHPEMKGAVTVEQ